MSLYSFMRRCSEGEEHSVHVKVKCSCGFKHTYRGDGATILNHCGEECEGNVHHMTPRSIAIFMMRFVQQFRQENHLTPLHPYVFKKGGEQLESLFNDEGNDLHLSTKHHFSVN